MDPITLLSFLSGAVALVREGMPILRDAFESGQIPPERQEEFREQYESLRAQAGGEFTGEQWELSGR